MLHSESTLMWGERLRVCRTLAGLSQTQLGKGIGITFQQVQKYERGANRISAGKLYALSEGRAGLASACALTLRGVVT